MMTMMTMIKTMMTMIDHDKDHDETMMITLATIMVNLIPMLGYRQVMQKPGLM